MDDKAYYKRLSADAESWREAGLIDAEQEGALKSWAAMRARKAPAPFSTLSLLAAAAFIIGVLSVLAANWARLSDAAHFIIIIAVLNLTLLGAGWLHSRNHKVLGEAAALSAAAMFGGAMILIGQSFNIQGAPEGLLFVWLLGAAAIAVGLRAGPALAFSLGLVLVWMFVRLSSDPMSIAVLPPPTRGEPLSDPGFWAVAPVGAALAGLAWRWRFVTAWHAAQILLWAWLAILVGALAGLDDSENALSLFGFIIALAGAATACAGFMARAKGLWGAGTLAGYAVSAALAGAFAACAGVEGDAVYAAIGVYLLVSVGVVMAGAYLQHRWAMALGIAGFMTAAGVLYLRTGGSLLVAGMILLLTAAGIGVLGWWLSRRGNQKGGE